MPLSKDVVARLAILYRHFGTLTQTRRQRFTKRKGTAMACLQQNDPKPYGEGADDNLEKSAKSQQSTTESQQSTSISQAYRLKKANIQIKKGSTPVYTTVIHPGLPSESFGLNGQPSLQSLLKTASFARMYGMHVPVDEEGCTFLEYNKLTSEAFTFFASTQVDILPAMYDFDVPKWPLEITIQPGHIGRTSLSSVSTMMTAEDAESGQQPLMTQISQMVLVDRVMRRPQPIKDHWRQKYLSHCVRGEPLIIQKQPVPQGGPLSVYEVKVAWSDTDIYQHTNFSNYPRFAVDAVHDALRQGRLGDHLSAADVAAGLSQVKVAYLGESVEGDVLTVQVWPGGGDSTRCVVCSMEKEGQVINQVTLSFFSPC